MFLNASKAKTVELSMYNQHGQLIGNTQRRVEAGENYILLKEINENRLNAGIYFVAVKDERVVSSEKFIVME